MSIVPEYTLMLAPSMPSYDFFTVIAGPDVLVTPILSVESVWTPSSPDDKIKVPPKRLIVPSQCTASSAESMTMVPSLTVRMDSAFRPLQLSASSASLVPDPPLATMVISPPLTTRLASDWMPSRVDFTAMSPPLTMTLVSEVMPSSPDCT